MDDTSPFSDKDPSQVATGADSAAVDPNPSPQSGRIAATLGRPVWEQFVTNSVARENNQGIVQAEQSYQTRTGMDNRQAEYDSRQAERIAARNSKEIWKGSHGKLLHKIGDTSEFLDPSDYVDHPVAGTEARKSLWQRDVKDAKTVAQGYADQLADPALNAKKMKQSDYDNAFAEGSTLQETDPRHIELKKQIMDHNDYVAQEKDLKQKHWDASTHAHALEATDPDEWHAAKKVADINANRGSIIQGAQDQHAEADTAAASLAQDQAALQARMAQGVKASELPAIQAQQEQHAQAQAVIDASKQTANAQLDTVKQAASSATVQSPASEGMMGTLTRNLATNMPGAFGTALGAVGGTALGGLAGIESGPVAIATGIAGGIAGGVGVHKLQTMLSTPDELATNAAQMEANAKEHPYVTQAANMASMLVGFMGGGGASVENVGGKVIGKALTKSGADVLRAGANGEVASTMASLIEKTTHGAAGFARVEGSTAAQEKYVDGKKDVSVLDRMAKGTIEGGSMGVVGGALFKPTAEALGAIGLFDTVKKVLWDSSKTVIPDVAAMQLSGDLYDHIVHGKEFNFNETVKRAGADVLPFVIQNLFMHGMGSLKSKMAGAGDGGENILKSVNDHLAATDPTLAPATADELQQAHQMFGGHADPAVAAKRYADGVLIHRQLTDIDAQDTQAVADAQSNLDAVRASGVDDKNAIPAAEAALETAKAGGGRADLVRASMKIASGQDMTNLTDAELTQLGVKRGKGDNFPTPLSSKELSANGLDSPLVREGADGSPILKDDAIKRVAAISPDARAKISMDETQADAAARSRAESEKQLSTSAPDGSQGEPAPGVGLPHETEAGVGKPIVPEVQATADPAKAPAKAEAAHPQHAATVKRALAHIAKIVSGKGRLGKAIEVSNDPKDRAVQNSGKITINPERLTKEALDNGMTPDQAHDHFKAVVDEEINHLAEHHAKVAIFNAAKGKGDPRSFKEWNNSHSKKLLDSDFAGAKGEKMRSVYTMTTDSQRSEWDAKTPAEKEEFKKEWAAKTDPERSSATSKELVSAQLANWDSMNDSQKLSESVRILMQERGKMGATERAKVVISEELKKYIQLVLHSLRTLAVGDGLTPEMAAYMKTMEEAIKDITTHDSARPTEPPAPKKDGNPPTPKAGPKPPPSEGAGPPAGAGQEAGGLKVGDRVAFNHPGAGGDAEGELVKLSPDGSNAIVSRNGVNFPVKTDSIRALDAPKDPVSETQAPKASTDETQTHRHQKPYSEMVKGDRFTDNGQEFQVWRNRQGTVEAHPIIDGKPIINNQSGVRFAVTEMAKLRNPDDRYLDDSKLSQTTPLADTPQTPTPQTNGRKEKASTQARKKGQVLNEPAAGDNTSPVADTALSEGDKKMLDALDGLFTSELPKNPAEDFEQKIPPDRFEKLMGAAASWVKEGVDSPEKLAAKLGSVADGKLKPFSQRIWSALHAAGADGDTQPDWVKMHAADIPIAAKAPRKGRNFNPSRTMELFHSNPFVDSILRQGGMMSASRARKEMGKAWWKLNSSQYEDAPRFNNPTFNSIYSRNGQLTPNRVAEGISGHGLMETGDVNRMWAELRKAADSTTNQNRTIGKEMVKSALAEKQTVEFSKVNQERESGVMGLQAGDFNPGEGHEFTIGGERFTVEANDGETVTIKDGEKFGEQRIPVDETLWVEISGADSFLPEEDVISGSGKLVDETIKQGYGSLDERDQSTPEDPGLGLVPKTESDRQGEGSAGVPQGGSPAQGDSGEVKRPPVSKMDINNLDNKELFADDGGFKLGQDSTVDGDKVAADLKAKEEAKAAQDAAQGDMFGEPPPPAPGTPEFKVLTAAEKQAAVKHLVARKQAGKITDFGEKLQGAKKDLWSGYRKSLSEELPSEASEITLSKHLPEPDYDKAIAEGVDPDSLATFKALRDLIPSKPRKGYKLERWVSSVKELRPLMKMLMDGNESGFKEALSKITDGNQSMKDQISLYKDLGHPAFTKAADWKILNGVTSFFKDGVKLDKPMSTQNALYKGRFISGMEATPDRAGYQELLGKIRKRILNELETPAEKNAKPVEFSLYRDRFTKELYVGKKAVNGVIRMKGGFADVKDARQYMTDNQAKLEEQWAGMKVKPDYRRQVNSPRQGPTRREGDATPESFQDAFGFRGVQFGNWVEDSRRQVDINEAFDAFMDLADAIGIPPKAVSLDGSLGMAFGARGNAGAAAHYEPGQVVINLTKKSGPGSLGHEWFHAFDNYFARLDKTGETKAKSLDSFATTNSGSPKHMRPEVWAAFKQIRAVLDKGPFAERSKTLDDAKSKSYYGTTIEKAARAFERYTVDRLAKKDVSNDYLVNIVKDFSPALPTPEEMSGGITQAFDHLFNTLDTKETDKGVALHTSELPKRKEKDPFYSKLERTVDEKIPNNASPAQVIATLTSSGVKAEEIKWSGIIPKLQELAVNGKVPKAAVLDYLRNEGAVKFEEVTQSGQHFRIVGAQENFSDARDEFDTEQEAKDALKEIRSNDVESYLAENLQEEPTPIDEDGDEVDPGDAVQWEVRDLAGQKQVFDTSEEAQSLINDEREWAVNDYLKISPDGKSMEDFNGDEYYSIESGQREDGVGTKYSEYTLPGGENYREVVLAMPDLPSEKMNQRQWLEAIGINEEKWNTFDQQEKEEINGKFAQYQKSKQDRSYTSSHFPDVPNYVAHMRTNERTDSNGKPGLFIEEIQSDRHQAGKKNGYKGENPTDDEVRAFFKLKDDVDPSLLPEYRQEMLDHKDFKRYAVADAPYRKDWPMAMFKRALRDSVASGKEWVGWTTGETQADRFDLSNQVDAIRWSQNDDGTFNIGFSKDGTWHTWKNDSKREELPDIVGKEVAQKIVSESENETSGKLSGIDLKVGGEGMKGFYDQILPKEIGKYVKQWGAKVEAAKITTQRGKPTQYEDFSDYNQAPKESDTPIWRIDITPEMKKGVESGQAVFTSDLPKRESNPTDKESLTVPKLRADSPEWKSMSKDERMEYLRQRDDAKASGEVKTSALPANPATVQIEERTAMENARRMATQARELAAKTPGLDIVKGVADGFKSLLLPTMKSPEHLQAAETLGAKIGEMNRRQESANADFAKDSLMFEKLGVHREDMADDKNPAFKFMSDMSTGRQMSPAMDGVAKRIEAINKTKIDLLKYAGAPLQSVRENYFPGVWTQESRNAFNLAMEEAQKAGIIDKETSVNDATSEQKAWVKAKVAEFLKDGKGSDKDALAYLTKTPFKGKESFRKRKVFDQDIMTAIEFGLKPVSANPIDIMKLKWAEMDRNIMANKAMQSWAKEGKLKIARLSDKVPDGWQKVKDKYGEVWGPREIAVTSKNSRLIDMEGHAVSLEEAGLDALPPEGTVLKVRLPGLLLMGHRIVPNSVGDVLNNYLSSSLYNNQYFGKLYTGWMGFSNALNQTQLGVGSFFHVGFTAFEVQTSANANVLKEVFGVIRGNRKVSDLGKSIGNAFVAIPETFRTGGKIMDAWKRPDGTVDPKIANVVRATELAGGGFTMERGMATDQVSKLVSDYHNGHELRAALRSPVAAIELMARPIMAHLVPRQKAGVFGHLANRIIEMNPGKSLEELTPEFRQAWNRIDARLGQVRYDRLFTNNVAKNVIQGMVRAPGWSGGTIAELGGSFKDVAKFFGDWHSTGKMPADMPDRVAYTASLLLTVGASNALLTYLFTGDKPTGMDYWAFRTGGVDEHGTPERMVLPTYMKDLLAYIKEPGTTLMNKSHPALSLVADLWRNKDYYGVEINHADDGVLKRIADEGKYVVKAFEPFWIRGVRKEIDREASPLRLALPQIGIMPAPKKMIQSPAEELAYTYAQSKIRVGSRTQEQADASREKYKIVEKLRKREPVNFGTAIKNGYITLKDIPKLRARASISALAYMVKKLDIDQAEAVYRKASPQEQVQLKAIILANKMRAKEFSPLKESD